MRTSLSILHSNDVHSHFDAWSRLCRLANQLTQELGPDRILRLDAGDFQDRSATLTEATRGMANMDLLRAAGVDAFTFGNNECLVWTVPHQSALAESVPFPVLAADLRLPDGRGIPGLRDWTIMERAGFKIGIFGIAREVDDFLEPLGILHRDPVQTAAECVAALRAEGCDLVILLSHMGINRDRAVATQVPGIDVIVGGHSHTELPAGEQVGGTVIAQAGGFGQYLGRLDLEVEDGRVVAWRAELLATADEEPDPATAALLAEWECKGQGALAEVVAYLPVPLPHDPLGDSPLMELMLHRLRTKFGAEMAIGHGGVLLGGLPAGPVTVGDLLRVCPCNLNPTIAEIPGRALLDLLVLPPEAFAQQAGRGGMRGDTVVGRVFGLGLEAIDPDRIYRAACNDYLSDGRGPFQAMKGKPVSIRYEMDQLMRDTLREALTCQHFVPGESVRIEIYGLDGVLRKAATLQVKRVSPDEVVLEAGPNYLVEMYEPGKSNWLNPHLTEYHLWPGKEFNLFRFYKPAGDWTGDYFNIIKPFAAPRPGVICYVDLELDVLLEAGSPAAKLLDEEELEEADYPPELKEHVRRVAADLVAVAGTPAAPGGVAPRRR